MIRLCSNLTSHKLILFALKFLESLFLFSSILNPLVEFLNQYSAAFEPKSVGTIHDSEI